MSSYRHVSDGAPVSEVCGDVSEAEERQDPADRQCYFLSSRCLQTPDKKPRQGGWLSRAYSLKGHGREGSGRQSHSSRRVRGAGHTVSLVRNPSSLRKRALEIKTQGPSPRLISSNNAPPCQGSKHLLRTWGLGGILHIQTLTCTNILSFRIDLGHSDRTKHIDKYQQKLDLEEVD